MRVDNIALRAAAVEFISRLDDYRVALAENEAFDREAGIFRNRPDFDGNWATFTARRPRSLGLASSALRRQSMELTRALAEMRKP